MSCLIPTPTSLLQGAIFPLQKARRELRQESLEKGYAYPAKQSFANVEQKTRMETLGQQRNLLGT